MAAAAKDRNFKNYAPTQAEEDAYDYVKFRTGIQPTSFAGAVAHIIKGALGGGILGGPVAYMKGGLAVALPINVIFGIYMGYCLLLLVQCTQTLMKRTRNPFMSYADCGEAAMMLFPKKNIARFSKVFRYVIDAVICIDLFGACCTYQIIVAKSLKQLIENTHATSMEGPPGYPDLRHYLLIMIPLFIIICLITRLKYLVPFSFGANLVVASAILMVVYYCFQNNPKFEGLTMATNFDGALQFIGLSVFAMSCAGVVIPIEGNMKDPKKFPMALAIGQGAIIFCTASTSLFGYAAFGEKSKAPFTINFPMNVIPIIFKAGICVMLYVTHALNFWVPFNLCWYYIGKHFNQNRIVMWERIFRALFVIGIAVIAIIFPSITGLMSFIGCFCLSNMAMIWPNVISLLVTYERPGYGRFRWRMWRAIVFILIGVFILVCGSVVSMKELVEVFK